MSELTDEQLQQVRALTDTQRDLLVHLRDYGPSHSYFPDRRFGNCLSAKTGPFLYRSFTRQGRPALWLTPLGREAAAYIWQNRTTMLKRWKPTAAAAAASSSSSSVEV